MVDVPTNQPTHRIQILFVFFFALTPLGKSWIHFFLQWIYADLRIKH